MRRAFAGVLLGLLSVSPASAQPPAPTAPQPPAPQKSAQSGVAVAAATPDVPFEVTEVRERCDNYDPNRQPFFGTTHLHTGLSFDASIRFVEYVSGNNPRGAYRFAKGLQRM